MKQGKIIALLAGAVVLLTGGYLALRLKNAEKTNQKQEQEAPVSLISFDGDATASLTVQNEEGTFRFLFQNQTWVLDGDEFTANPYTVSAICSYMCNLNSVKTIAKDVTDLSPYGLSDPVKLTAVTDSGDSYQLLVGNPTPTNESYYAMLPGTTTVYTIDYTSGSVFRANKNTLKNRYLLDAYSTEITEFSLERDGKLIYSMTHDAAMQWIINQPIQWQGYTSNINEILDTFVRATATAFVDNNPSDLSQYGLDQPSYRLHAKTDAKETTILLGKMVSNAENEVSIYGMFQESGQVFYMTKAALNFLDDDLLSVAYPYVYNPDASTVKQLVVDCNEVQATLELDTQNKKYSCNGVDISDMGDEVTQAFQDFYQAVATMGLSQVDPDAKPEGEAAISFTYTLQSGEVNRVELIPASDTTYWIMKNGTYTNFMTRKKILNVTGGIISSYETLQKKIQEASK